MAQSPRVARVRVGNRFLPNMGGRIDRATPYQLSRQTLAAVARTVRFDSNGLIVNPQNIPAAYDIIYRQLSGDSRRTVNDPYDKFPLNVPGPFRDVGTLMWFEQARYINANTGGAGVFIRTYTNIAAGDSVSAAQMQGLSNTIASNVLRTILQTGSVAPLHEIIGKDISVVVNATGKARGGA